jgi:ubiquinone/menaquinone biosynthesis C-methylase UbiE
MAARDRLAADPTYLRRVQYRDGSRLAARAQLHVKYGTAAVAWNPWLASQIDWPRRGRVLEVGCGPGWLWVEAAAHLRPDLDLTLTDLSDGMVAEARAQVGRTRSGRAVALTADAQALPFDPGEFDVVVANHMLYHVPDPAVAVAELARVLRPEGTLLAATNGPRHLRELGEIRETVFGGTDPLLATARAFGIESGEPLLRECFGAVEWRPYEDELVCTDRSDVLAFIGSTPPAEDATEAERRELEAVVAERFDAGGGVLRITKESGAFVCRRPRSPQ